VSIGDDVNVFEGDEPFGDHFVEEGKHLDDAFGLVDDLDDHREIFGQAQDLRRVNAAAGAEARQAAKGGSMPEYNRYTCHPSPYRATAPTAPPIATIKTCAMPVSYSASRAGVKARTSEHPKQL